MKIKFVSSIFSMIVAKYSKNFCLAPRWKISWSSVLNFFKYFPAEFFGFSFNRQCKIGKPPGYLDRVFTRHIGMNKSPIKLLNDTWKRLNNTWERLSDTWERLNDTWERLNYIWKFQMQNKNLVFVKDKIYKNIRIYAYMSLRRILKCKFGLL